MLPLVFSWLRTAPAVTAIIGNPPRAFRHGDAPQDTIKPYVTWQLISGIPDNDLSRVPVSDRFTIQVDCWHQTDSGIELLAKAVRDAIEPYGHMTGMPVNEREPETKLYRIAMQFDILQNR